MAEARESNLNPERRHRQSVFAHRRPSKWIWQKSAKCGQHELPPTPLLAPHLKLQVESQCRWKASPWKGFASKPGQISLSAYQPRIYSASLGYSLRELGIIAKVMTVMMSLYLAYVPILLPQHQPPPQLFPFNSFIPPIHITVHSVSRQSTKRMFTVAYLATVQLLL